MRALLVLFLPLAVLSSCEKKETPVDRPPVTETVEIPMGSDYEKQYYFDLESNEVVKVASRFDWDLAFESSAEGYRVFINSYKFMFAYNTGSTNFDSIYTYNQFLRRWDEPTGELNKTAFGEWGMAEGSGGTYLGKGNVYIVDRGVGFDLTPVGYKKVLVNSLENGNYDIAFADLNSTVRNTFTIPKADGYHKAYMSFDNGGQIVTVAPRNDEWDLLFTRYTHVFYEPLPGFPPTDTLPYQVVGVFSNHQSGVEVATIPSAVFDSFSLADAASLTFSRFQNAIGFDWKNFTLNDENYVVDANRLYIIKTVEGNYYKLRFVEFYNNAGIKGYPTFEVQELR